jgi:hypothetical protein
VNVLADVAWRANIWQSTGLSVGSGEDLQGLPVRSCKVMTEPSEDQGAIDSLTELLDSPGCGPSISRATHAVWSKRGQGYLVIYDFLRSIPSPGTGVDALSFRRVGTDQTLSAVDIKKVCEDQ